MSNNPMLYHPLTWVGGAIALLLSWGFTVYVQKLPGGSLIVGKSGTRGVKRHRSAVQAQLEREIPPSA